jgi:hypothetical protein
MIKHKGCYTEGCYANISKMGFTEIDNEVQTLYY